MKPVSPVLPGHDEIEETTFAKDQPEYLPLPAVIVPGPEREVLTRWELSDEEKALLVNGGYVYLSLVTFGHPLQPIMLRVATPDQILREQRVIQSKIEDATNTPPA